MPSTIAANLTGRKNNFHFIRFAAAIAVIFSHAFDLSSHQYEEPLRQLKGDMLSIGNLAVAAFFIISGFLVYQSLTRSVSLSQFFYSRALRIYPALITVTLISVFIIGPSLTSLPLKAYFSDPKTLKYLINLTCLKIYIDLPGIFEYNYNTSFNGSLWTLAHELICYIVVASVMLISIKRVKTGISLFLFIVFINLASRSNVFFHPYFYHHCYYFLLGCLLFGYKERIKLELRYLLLALTIFAINLLFNTEFISLILLNGLSLGYLVIFFGLTKEVNLQGFSKYGDFSYGIYISAFPIQQYLYFKQPALGCYTNFAITSAIALCIGILSWNLIEKPFLKLKRPATVEFPESLHTEVIKQKTAV